METSQAWIQAIKDKLSSQGINPSDYRVAQVIDVTRSAISKHKTEKSRVFPDEVGIRIAEFLELDSRYVLACLAAERTEDPAVKAAHESLGQIVLDLAKKGRSAAAGILAGIVMISGTSAPDRGDLLNAANMADQPAMYIMLNLMAAYLARLLNGRRVAIMACLFPASLRRLLKPSCPQLA